MSDRYDLVVIGTGAVGQTVAYKTRDAGWSVAVVDRGPFGGTCPNDGCDAKKPFVSAAAVADLAGHLAGHGLRGDAAVDWGDAARWSREFSDPIDEGTRERLAQAGIEVIAGNARFTGRDSLAVEIVGDGAPTTRTLTAQKIVVATGSHPRPLDLPGSDGVIDSTDLMRMEDPPRRIAFIGGGFISFEFAHALARSGRDATIYHGDDRPLPGFERDMVGHLVAATRDLGIEVRLNARVAAVERRDARAQVVMIEREDGDPAEAGTHDLVVHGAGRVPSIAGLDVGEAGLEVGERGLLVDERGRCRGNPDVLAGGDVAETSLPMLLQVASHHARVLTATLLDEQGPTMTDARPVSVLFTTPELAGVGVTEEDARRDGASPRVVTGPDKRWKAHRQLAQEVLRYKTITDEGGHVLGAWVLGVGASDLVNLVALAMANDLTVDDLRAPLYGYPTISGHVASLFKG